MTEIGVGRDMRRRRVLFVVSSISRAGAGVAESVRLLAKAVSEQSVDVEVMTLEDKYYRQDVDRWYPLSVRGFPMIGSPRYGFSPALCFRLLGSGADLVHVHGVWTFHCLAVYLWALLRRRPYVVTPHGMLEGWVRKRSPILKRIISLLYHTRFLRGAALFHLLTENESVDCADFASGGRSRVVPNYVEPFEQPPGRPGWWENAFEGRDVYLFFGRIHEVKGCAELCRAWDTLCAGDHAFRERSVLVFCGWIDGVRGFEQCVAEVRERHGNVVFSGPQYGEDKKRSIAAASFFLLPSRREGLPMSVLEAWAAGKPVLMTAGCNLAIGFDVGAAIEIGADEEGIRIGLRSASALTTERRSEMGRAGRRLVAERYSAHTVAAGMMALYHDALMQ